jgi:thymidylate synthase (FAD)
MDTRAQYEIRSYATLIGENIVSRWCPLVWEAFREYRLGVVNLSNSELELIRLIQIGNPKITLAFACKSGLVSLKEGKIVKSREWEEFQGKLELLGLPLPALG